MNNLTHGTSVEQYYNPTVDTVDLEIIKHRIALVTSPAFLRHLSLKTTSADEGREQLCRQLEMFLTGNSNRDTVRESYKHPETWWDAFKDRFFTAWLKKKFPVKFKTVGVKIDRLQYFMCPHLNYDYSPHQLHVKFFLTNPSTRIMR